MDKNALSRATDSSSAPTPGYLYNDIARSLVTPMACAETCNYLVGRLGKSSVHVKRKSLKVLAKVAASPASRGMMKRTVVQNPARRTGGGCPDLQTRVGGAMGGSAFWTARTPAGDLSFRKKDALPERRQKEGLPGGRGSASKQFGQARIFHSPNPLRETQTKWTVTFGGSTITAIKEAAQYRGQSDAVHGDRFNLEVREAAKECLEVVYSDSGDAASGAGSAGGPAMSGQLQGGGMAGLGANSSSSAGYGPNAGSATMEGIGNPMFADPRLSSAQDTSGMGRVAEMASSVGGAMLGMIKDPLARSAAGGEAGMPRPGGGYGGPEAVRDPYAQPPGRANLAMQTGGQWTMASNRGPNAVGSAGNAVGPPPAQQQQQQQQQSEYYKARNNTR
ncbi:hypothetical protein THAOC_09579, partial [Thalassiosira oceanica]